MKWKQIGSHIVHWLLETVLFALFPLFLYLIFRWIFQLRADPTQQYITELCSCTLAVAVADSSELAKDKYRKKRMRSYLIPFHVILSLFFATVYGVMYLLQLTDYPLSAQSIQNMFITVKVICVSHFAFSVSAK